MARQKVYSIRRGCDICGSPLQRVLHEQRFVSFDGDAGLLAGYNVVVCGLCGFVYADGLPELSVFERYYSEMSKHEPEVDEKRLQPAYKQHNVDLVALPITKRLPDRAARILDVGVGSGDTLVALRELGYTDLTGLDPSRRTADVVQRKHQLRVLNTPISQLHSCRERFDVILLSGVLEHLRDLQPTVALLKTLLRPNGKMCVAVPNASRFPECVESPYQYLSVEHINFFTLRSLESLFKRIGMELQSSWESTALLGVFKEPIIHGIFKQGETSLESLPDPDGASKVARYVAHSALVQKSLTSKIHGLVHAGEGVLIWGAGSLTLHLLTEPTFAQLNIVAFVDANANYWDKNIMGAPVVSPATVKNYRETILVVSFSYEAEICSQIRTQYKLDNKIVGLFGMNGGQAALRSEESVYG